MGMTKWHLYLMRNITTKDGKEVTFMECYNKLRCYLSGHIKMLIMSKIVKQDVKDKLEQVLFYVSDILKSGINVHDIQSLEL